MEKSIYICKTFDHSLINSKNEKEINEELEKYIYIFLWEEKLK